MGTNGAVIGLLFVTLVLAAGITGYAIKGENLQQFEKEQSEDFWGIALYWIFIVICLISVKIKRTR